jgi:6-phosphofructokinase 2
MADILTFTPNPALDVLTRIHKVSPTHKMRCEATLKHPGGGGVNVARVLHRLGANVVAVYPSGGITGERHHHMVHLEGMRSHVVPITEETRESFSVHETASGEDFRFVLPGPVVSEAQWQACLDHITQHWPKKFLVLSGGLSPGMPDDLYARLIRAAKTQGVPVVLDANGPALNLGLQAQGVTLFKPSLRELQELTGETLDTDERCVRAARALIVQHASQMVAVSLGGEGAMLVTATDAWRAPALTVAVQTTIGAGDSFVGGMVWSLARGDAPDTAFRWGMAAGAASLLRPGTALCEAADVQRLVQTVTLQRL